jgi:hypothetical protein
MNGSGSEHLTIPSGYKFLSIINNTDNVIYIYAETRSTNEPDYALVKVPNYTSITIPIDGRLKYTFFYTDGGGAGNKKAELIYAVENLQINSLLGTQIAGTVTIGADGVGLSRQNQLPTDLSGEGNLKVGLAETEGKTALKVTAGAAGTQPIKAAAGKVYAIKAGAADVKLLDNGTEKWLVDAGKDISVSASPITCGTSIDLNFSAAGDAYIIYE